MKELWAGEQQTKQNDLCAQWKLETQISPVWADATVDLVSLLVAQVMLWPQLIWAATWQNQQNECAPSEDSDQPGFFFFLFVMRFYGPVNS